VDILGLVWNLKSALSRVLMESLARLPLAECLQTLNDPPPPGPLPTTPPVPPLIFRNLHLKAPHSPHAHAMGAQPLTPLQQRLSFPLHPRVGAQTADPSRRHLRSPPVNYCPTLPATSPSPLVKPVRTPETPPTSRSSLATRLCLTLAAYAIDAPLDPRPPAPYGARRYA